MIVTIAVVVSYCIFARVLLVWVWGGGKAGEDISSTWGQFSFCRFTGLDHLPCLSVLILYPCHFTHGELKHDSFFQPRVSLTE